MWYTYTNGHYYMIVYNTDETTDESNTYRFTCYVSLYYWVSTRENIYIACEQ